MRMQKESGPHLLAHPFLRSMELRLPSCDGQTFFHSDRYWEIRPR